MLKEDIFLRCACTTMNFIKKVYYIKKLIFSHFFVKKKLFVHNKQQTMPVVARKVSDGKKRAIIVKEVLKEGDEEEEKENEDEGEEEDDGDGSA